MGLDQLAPEMVCARLEFGREVESGGKGGERSVLTWDHMCVCVCACLGFGREVELEGKGGERSVLTWDRACVCVCVRVCVCAYLGVNCEVEFPEKKVREVEKILEELMAVGE